MRMDYSPHKRMTNPNPTPSANYTALVAYIVSVVPTVRCNDCNEICDVAPCHCGSFCSYTDEETPIMLDDVLRALEKSILSLGAVACVTSQGRFMLKMPNGNFENGDGAFKDWQLGKPLSGQDKDTINWLVSLFPISK